jgi:Calx-beta domain-containing protein
VQLGASAFAVTEGTSAVITVERTGTLGTVIVPYSTAALPGVCPAPNGSGRACPGVDFTSRSGSLTFNPGVMSLTISVPTLANSRQEGNRAFVINLGAPGGTAGAVLGPITTGTVTIVDNDRAGAIAFFGNPYRSSELGAITLSVRRASTTVAGPVTVNFATADGSAKAGVDYVPTAGTLTFGVGSTVASITVNVLPNTRDDGDRTFLVALSGPTGGATLGNPSVATVTIGDDDVGGTIQFSAPTFAATECAALPCFASLTLSRAGGGASAVSVDFVTVDGTGNALSDYIATSGTVTFGANQAAATVRIPLQIEPGAQMPKTFGVILSSPRGGAVLGARTTATVTVTDTR